MRKPFLLSVLFITLFPSVSSPGVFGPSDYDECILKEMKGVTDKYVANHIARACRNKFPEKIEYLDESKVVGSTSKQNYFDKYDEAKATKEKSEILILPESDISKIEIVGTLSDSRKTVDVEVFNATDWKISKLIISVAENSGSSMQSSTNDYPVVMFIAPWKRGSSSVDIREIARGAYMRCTLKSAEGIK